MEESNYKHNYEYLSIEEAKTIVNGTFVQGTTNIGGELATKDDIDHLVDNANKRLTSIVPVTDTSNEFICFFECEDIETFPDEWTYVFHYDVSGTSGSSSTPTSWTKQYNVDGQQINNNLVLNGITSYKIKTGSLGTVQRENVSYSGQVGSPSGYNYSEQEATGSGHLTQNGSGKQLQWSYTQNANVKVWNISADKTSLSFPANGGTRSVQITTWYTWQYNNNNNQKFDQNTTTENITAEANTLQQQKTWTKVITKNNKSVSIQCTQEGAQEQFPDDLQHRWIRVQPESSQISVDGGTINVTGSYGLTGTFGTERKVGDITDTIVVESNSTQGQKSGSKTYYYNNNQSDTPTVKITWTQPGRAEEFPDDEAHRWIEITPTNAGNFTEAGGTITVTGSYGLTGSYGTKRTVGQINDTITVEKNTTTQTKSGSKTYYYNNTPGTDPSATVTWTQDACSRIDPTDVTISDITMNVGESKQLSYNVTPANSTIDSVSYEIVSGSDLAHIENSTIYADKEGSVTYKVTINNSITATASVVISDTYTYKDVYDIKSDLKIPGADNCGYVFNYNEIDSNNAKYFYVNAHRDKIGSKGNVVSSEKINYTFIKDGDIDNFTVNVNKQNNKGSDEYQIYPKLENSGNSNYELSISIKKEDSDIVFLFNAIHICKDYTKVNMQDIGFFSSIDHKYQICEMDHRISTNLYIKNKVNMKDSLYWVGFNYSGYSRELTRLGINDKTLRISNLNHFLQNNNVARGYFTLYLCKYNQYGNIYNTEKRTTSHTLNFNFWEDTNVNEGTIYSEIFNITKDFTAVELSGVEYNGMNPDIIPLERYTKMYDLLFYPCSKTMVYKIY